MRKVAVAVLLAVAAGLFGLDLAPPMDEYITTSGIGPRAAIRIGGGSLGTFHMGRDLKGPPGSPVKAMAPGKVVQVYPPPGVPYFGRYYRGHPVHGGMVLIKHNETLFTRSSHLSRVDVKEGWHVWTGRQIGVQGSTGMSTGDHLHVEVIVDPAIPESVAPERVDPMDRIAERFRLAYLAHKAETWNVVP